MYLSYNYLIITVAVFLYQPVSLEKQSNSCKTIKRCKGTTSISTIYDISMIYYLVLNESIIKYSNKNQFKNTAFESSVNLIPGKVTIFLLIRLFLYSYLKPNILILSY